VNPTRVLLSLLAERLGQTAGRWPRQLFGGAEAPTLREAIAARVEPRLMAPDAGQFGDRPLRVFHGTPEEFSPEGIRPWSHFGTENAARQRLEALVDPQHRGAESGPPMRVLPYEITGRRIDVGAEPLGTGDISPGQISDMLQRGGGASGAGQNAYREQLRADGFDVETRLYHGRSSDFAELRLGRNDGPIYLTDRPDVADIYADAAQRRWPGYDNAGPNVMPVFVRRQNPLVVSDLGPNGDHGYLRDNLAEALGLPLRSSRKELRAAAVERGHDVIEVRNMADLGGEQTQYLVLRPENVRSAIGPAPDAPNSVSRTDGGASGAGNAADRFRTNDTPVPVNEGWDTAGSLQQGVDDLAAQRGGWDTMGGRDMGEALIRRHGLDGALEQINRIMADPASRRARQRNGDQGAWEAVQRYIQASVNRRGIGLAPDAPNAGQRGGNGAALAALATLPPGAITLRELLRDHYGTA